MAFIILSPLLFVALMILIATRDMPKVCPECDTRMSAFTSPYKKTVHQWLYGGYQCSNCQCELDKSGRVLGHAVQARRLSPIAATMTLALPVIVCLMLPLLLIYVFNQ